MKSLCKSIYTCAKYCLIPFFCGTVCGVILLRPTYYYDRTNDTTPESSAESMCRVFEGRNVNWGANSTNNCSNGEEIRLLVLVMTTPNANGAELRSLARKSIYQHLPQHITVKFVLGTKKLAKKELNKLTEEQNLFKDLLLLDGHKEGYYELPRKVQHTILWVDREYDLHFDYVVKTDDDVIVFTDKLVKGLIKMGCPDDLYWGCCFFRKPIDKGGKWKETKWFNCGTYLPYCGGLGYVLGRKVVHAVAKYVHHSKHYRLEDATMGLWLAPYHLTRKNDEKLFALTPTCSKDVILSHQFNLANFKKAATSLTKSGFMCS